VTWWNAAVAAAVFLVIGFVVVRLWPPADDEVVLVGVPDLVGLSSADATSRLDDLGFEVETRQVDAPDAEPGAVVDQDPVAGTPAEVGSVVVLHVARRPSASVAEAVTVPDLRGLALDAAVARLEGLDLVVATKSVVAEGFTEGTIVEQDPAPGSEVDPGSTVRLQVARAAPAAPNPIAWILGLGLDAPTGPPQFQAYALLLDNDCQTLAQRVATPDDDLAQLDAELGGLYGAAADACLAAFHDQPALWTDAEQALPTIPLPVSCVDVAAYELLGRLVARHQANPEGEFMRQVEPGAAEAPRCPTISGIEPAQPAPGDVVLLFGTNLGAVLELRTLYDDGGGDTFAPPEREGDALRFRVGEFSEASEGCVYLVAGDQWNAAGYRFSLAPAPGATGSPPAPVFELEDCPPESGG
jgi:hypothetical protein